MAQDDAGVEFIENKGQWDQQVRFMARSSTGGIFLHQNGFTILQQHPDDVAQLIESMHGAIKDSILGPKPLRGHAYRMEFINSNPASQVVPEKEQAGINNYFIGNDPARWASYCKLYGAVTIKNIYAGVDVRYYAQNSQMKYDLILAPGADLSQIAIRYVGANGLKIKNGALYISTSIGELKESEPYSYQPGEAGRKTVAVKYVLKGNEIRFAAKNYDRSQPLIIDPTLIFCSFSGSTADNWGFTATYGPDGSMYAGGIVKPVGFPVSLGAFQATYQGGGNDWDMGIIKLSSNGSQRLYATYIGGNSDEQPHSLIVDPQGNLVIAGRTASGADYPTTANGLFGDGGGYDIVVTKLNATGTALIGSRRIGGSSDDGVNINPTRNGTSSLQQNYGDDGRSEVILDAASNVYLASSSQSLTTKNNNKLFPVKNAFQPSPGKEEGQDAVVMKFSPDLSNVLFSSFLGGSGNDAAYVLSLNPFNNNIYVAGGTESNNFPGTAGRKISNSYAGSIDGYVAIISNNGSSLIGSTYLGTSGIDQVYGVQFDKFGFPYVTGQTTGDWPVINAPWSQAGAKQFISKLQPDLSAYVYSTTFGTRSSSPNISPTAFLVDRCENVYVSGWGGAVIRNNEVQYRSAGTRGLSITPDAIQSTTDGNDFYFFVLRRDATEQLFGSFFGQNGSLGDHVDGGTSRFDRDGVIYQGVCANCDPRDPARFPTTPGAWSPRNPSKGCNLAMIKIAFNLAGVRAGLQSAIEGQPRDTAGCIPLTVAFRDTVQQAASYEWLFGDGSAQVTTKEPYISHTYTQVGTYRVMMVAIDSTTCNIRDTSYINIKAGEGKAELGFIGQKQEPCSSFIYKFVNTSAAPANKPFSNEAFDWDFGDGSPLVRAGMNDVMHQYASAGTYYVRLILRDSNYCNYPDDTVQMLRVSILVKAAIETPALGCAPYTAVFNNISAGGERFEWDFGDGTTSTEINPSHLYQQPGRYIVKLKAYDPNTCNRIDSTQIIIELFEKPIAAFSAAAQPPVENQPITFTNESSPDAIRFKWLFGDTDTLESVTRAPVQHEYNSTGTWEACLIAINKAGCADTVCQDIQTLVNPAVDVPNAFTPLQAGTNSRVHVRGYGIAKMKFVIWNRWGQKMFESNAKETGWDGKFKGVLQPMDVYVYTLEVEFTDGTRASKKGDITLIR